jgi:hypothetical protein
MTYATASMTSATPAKDLMTAIGTTLTTAGFTFVESTGTAPATASVYKSPAASNQFGQDWYLILKRTADAATALYYQVAEGYNALTHLASNYGGTGVSVIPVSSTGANPMIPAAPDTIQAVNALLTVQTTAFTYWVSATVNRLIVGVNAVGVERAFYAGLYDDLLPAGMVGFPLVCAKFPTTQLFGTAMGYPGANLWGGFTRDPGQALASASNFEASIHNGYWGAPISAALSGNLTPMTTTAALYGNSGSLSRAMIGAARLNNATGDAIRGLLNGCWTSAVSSAAGDTTTVGGKTYTRFAGPATTFGFFVDQAL